MSVDKLLREMVAAEVEQALAPVHAALAELQANAAVLERIAAALGQPIKRGPGRPAKAFKVAPAARKGRKAAADSEGKRACAVQGCGRPARSKGYCAAHYQKFRMLDRTGRLPSDWVPDAPPNSVKNIKLPRGRAGAKALAELKKK
ncbi:MAG: cell wall protein [Myxococcota bacterium]